MISTQITFLADGVHLDLDLPPSEDDRDAVCALGALATATVYSDDEDDSNDSDSDDPSEDGARANFRDAARACGAAAAWHGCIASAEVALWLELKTAPARCCRAFRPFS